MRSFSLERLQLAARREPIRFPAAAIAAAIVFAVAAALVGSGRLTGYLAGGAIVILPVLAAVAVARPYVFPYGAYIVLIPFDNILNIGHSGTVTKYLGLVAAGALLFFILRTRRAVRPPVSVAAWAGYAMWVAASVAWAVDPTAATTTALSVAEYVALYAIIAVSPIGRGDLRWLTFIIVVSGAIAGAYGAWVFHHDQSGLSQQYDRLILSNGADGGIDANHYANAMVFPALLATMRLLNGRRWFHAAWVFPLAAMLTGIYLSASREALVAYAVGLIVIAVLAARYRARLTFVALFVLGAAAATPWVWLRFSEAFKTGGSGRASIWMVGFAAAKEHWLIGVGESNFHVAYNDVYLSVFQRYHAGWDRVAHNDYLQALVELGVIGLAALLIAGFTTLRSGTARAEETEIDRELDDLRVVSIAALVALAVAAMFIDMLVYKYFWLALCFATQIRTVARGESRAKVYRQAPVWRSAPIEALARL